MVFCTTPIASITCKICGNVLNISIGFSKPFCNMSFMLNISSYLLFFQNGSFQTLLPMVRQRIIDGFNPKALDLFQREFDFFDKVTNISGALYPLPKEERRAGIRRYTYCFFKLLKQY